MTKRLLAVLLALLMIVGLLPVMALADGANAQISIADDCSVIGSYEDEDCVYYYPTEIPYGTENVEFTDLADSMETGMIASVIGNDYVMGTNVAPINDGYSIFEFDEDWEIDEAFADLDFTGAYCYWIMDDDYTYYYVIVKVEQPGDTFDLASDECVEIGEYMSGPVYYYEGEIPSYAANIRFVDFEQDGVSMISGLMGGTIEDPTNEAPLSGAYSIPDSFADNDYWEPKAEYEDFDFSDKDLYWIFDKDYSSTSFIVNIPPVEQIGIPFTATANGEQLAVSLSPEQYECYGVPTDLYVVAIPLKYIEMITLDFGENEYIATYYDAEGNYGGAYTEWTEGVTSFDVPDFDVFVWVQTPYASDYMSGGDTQFVVCFKPVFDAFVAGTNTRLTECEVAEDGYQYTGYTGVYTGDLYTLLIPYGVDEVDFVFPDNCLAYNYNGHGSSPVTAADEDFLAGMYEDFIAGADTATRKVDYNEDGTPDYIQVQNVYNADWSGAELRYAITFKYLFGASVDGEPMTQITAEPGAYTTYSYGPAPDYELIAGDPVTVYTIALPDDTTSVDLTFPQNVLAYNYRSDGMTYIAGDFDATVGVNALTVDVDADGDGEPDYIQVQNLYNEDWTGGEVIYAITFDVGGLNSGDEPGDLTAEQLRDNIAAKYAETGVAADGNAQWLAADMMAYLELFPDTDLKLSDEQKQDMVDVAIAGIAGATKPSDVAKNIIALAAMGFDPKQLTTGEGEELDAVTKLDELTFTADGALTSDASSIYTLPYILIAYQQFNDCEEKCLELVAAAVESKDAWLDTSWGIDAITPMMLALSPWYSEADVKAAVDAGVEGIAAAQLEDGSIGDYSGNPNACSTGLAMAGLAAIGVDPSTFVYEGTENSLVDGLVLLAGEDGASIKPTGNSYATEQGFRGLVAAAGAQDRSYKIYDFGSYFNERVPAAATPEKAGIDFTVTPSGATVTVTDASGATVDPSSVNELSYYLDAGTYTWTVSKEGYVSQSGEVVISDDDAANAVRKSVSVALEPDAAQPNVITVTVQVLGHDADTCGNALTYKNDPDKYFSLLPVDSYQVQFNSADATAADALLATLIAYNIEYDLQSNGYFAMIGGLRELDHGDKSGWLYMIDGEAATTTADQCRIDKDVTMVWFYTDDYTNDYGSEAWAEPGDEPGDEEPPTFTDVPEDHWASEYIEDLASRGIIKGYGDGTFGVNDPIARCDIVVILYRLNGEEETEYTGTFSDVADGEYYSAAIEWAAKNGIVKGYDDGRFDPNGEVTKEQLAVMLFRLANYKGIALEAGDLSAFSDADDISDFAVEAVAAMVGAGIINGTPEGKIMPQASASRCEVAKMISLFDALS